MPLLRRGGPGPVLVILEWELRDNSNSGSQQANAPDCSRLQLADFHEQYSKYITRTISQTIDDQHKGATGGRPRSVY